MCVYVCGCAHMCVLYTIDSLYTSLHPLLLPLPSPPPPSISSLFLPLIPLFFISSSSSSFLPPRTPVQKVLGSLTPDHLELFMANKRFAGKDTVDNHSIVKLYYYCTAAVLHYAILHFTILWCTVLHCVVLSVCLSVCLS